LRLGDTIGAVHAAGTADVLDNDGLAEDLAHPLREQPRRHVVGSARGEWINHGQRARRPFLGRHIATGERAQRNKAHQKRFSHDALHT